MKKLISFVIFTITSLISFSQNNVVDEVVWVVGDEAILLSDVERIRNYYGTSLKGNPYCVIPEELAVQKLFLHQAALDSIEVSDVEVNRYVEAEVNHKVMEAGSKEKLEEYMQMPMKKIREEIFEQTRTRLLMQQVKNALTKDIKVTPAEVRRHYSRMPEDSLPFIPTQVEVQILVQHPKIARDEIERVKERCVVGQNVSLMVAPASLLWHVCLARMKVLHAKAANWIIPARPTLTLPLPM